MKIFYDHQVFSLQDFGGISRLYAELIFNINNKTPHSAKLSCFISNNIHLKEKGYNIPQIPFLAKNRSARYCINKMFNYYELSKSSYDIYHPTYYSNFIMKKTNKPKVVTFLDMIHERFYKQYDILNDQKLINNKKEAIELADKVIAISKQTKNDIVEYYKIDPSKIEVIYLGSSLKFLPINKTDSLRKPYLLYVGNREFYKNFSFMLDGLATILLKYDIDLVCAGGKNFNENEIKKIKGLGLSNRVFYEDINDTKLAMLYSNAIAFIFPSLYEGFGIPVLEAFSCNCPCVLSNTSSLPEVGGDCAVYFDPYDADSLKYNVEKLIHDSSLRLDLIEKGKKRATLFSWMKNTEETIELYNSLI